MNSKYMYLFIKKKKKKKAEGKDDFNMQVTSKKKGTLSYSYGFLFFFVFSPLTAVRTGPQPDKEKNRKCLAEKKLWLLCACSSRLWNSAVLRIKIQSPLGIYLECCLWHGVVRKRSYLNNIEKQCKSVVDRKQCQV